MSYPNVGAMSLTPSRPAPPAPQRRQTDNALASVGYNLNLNGNTPYGGVGGSPRAYDGGPPSAAVVRQGAVSVKEDGFASWLWRPKWLVLKETTLTLHKSDVRAPFARVCPDRRR
jgi:hypothetical protein